MSFKEIQKEKTAQIERILKAYLPRVQGYQEVIMDAMSYSMLAGGKRLRPMLMQETYRMFGGADRVIEPFMAAIEMIHTSSLVHDDLPCMDDDMIRRGKASTWVWQPFSSGRYPAMPAFISFTLSSSSFLNAVLSIIIFTLAQYLNLFFYFINLSV